MLGETEIRYARLAVSRYGADPGRVQAVLRAVFDARARGEKADLLAALRRRQLLTRRQAHNLRGSLSQTHPGDDGEVKEKPPELTAPPIDSLGDVRQLGEFRVLRRLGEGGMGTVYLAFDKANNRQVALKVLTPGRATVRGSLDRFQREGRSGLSLSHPNIVRIFDARQDAGTGLHYLVLEYVDGPSAHDLLEQLGRLAVGDAVRVGVDVARALAYAHEHQFVHRDIKPGNILLTAAGVAKLSDLGLAKRTTEASQLTSVRHGIGTPYYMPYEQAITPRRADHRSDVFALGATLYHLLTGEVPFPGDDAVEVLQRKELGVFLPARALNPDVPEALDGVITRMMALKPEDRHPTASDVLAELEKLGVAAEVPGFARALASSQPRPSRPGATPPTLLDVPAGGPSVVASRDWFVRFRNRQGKLCRARLTQTQLVRRLRERKLGPRTEASRTGSDYRPVAEYAEFAETLRAVNPRRVKEPPAAATTRWGWVVAAVLGAGVIVLVLTVVFLGGR